MTWSYRYPSCDNVRDHQRDAERDAQYDTRSHRPSPWDNDDCRAAYDDEYRRQRHLIEDREREEAEEAARLRRLEETHAEWRRQEEMEEQCRLEQYRLEQEQAEREEAGTQAVADEAQKGLDTGEF